MAITTLSAKFQISIPKSVREQLHLQRGQKFVFVTKGNALHLVPIRDIQEYKGTLKGANKTHFRDHKDR